MVGSLLYKGPVTVNPVFPASEGKTQAMEKNHSTNADKASDAATWVDRHGDALFRYAMLRVRDAALAEDLVQETFLAALRAHKTFGVESSERTWLVAILKHKIIDHFRRQGQARFVSSSDASDNFIETLFDEKGGWKLGPSRIGNDPSNVLERKEFWDVFRRCLSKLPGRWAEAFSLREMDELGTREVCNTLGLSTTNLGVILHRARVRLWQCLEANWFGSSTERT
jgi:RNA polymerase sigma-70 factor (ECF subfamily)